MTLFAVVTAWENEMGEPRKSQRARTMLGAQIIFNNRSSTVDCQIRNMSEDGAKIIVHDHLSIPQHFEFHVPQKGRSFRAKVIWRKDNEAGLEFLQDNTVQAGTTSATNLYERLKELETENASLRRRVVDLQARLDRDMMTGA